MRRFFMALLACGTLVSTTSAKAGECAFTKPADEMSAEEVTTLYDCVKDKLVAAYSKAGHEVGTKYRSWKSASTRPAAPGQHGERFLMTFVNDIGYDAYVEFKPEGAKMPAGTVVAKESYKANKKNKLAIGPLFIMTKLKDGGAPKYGDWKYSGVGPNGKEFKVSQKFCHDCHAVFAPQDALGYPVEDVRVKK